MSSRTELCKARLHNFTLEIFFTWTWSKLFFIFRRSCLSSPITNSTAPPPSKLSSARRHLFRRIQRSKISGISSCQRRGKLNHHFSIKQTQKCRKQRDITIDSVRNRATISEPITCGQSYKHFTVVNYDSTVVPDFKIPHITTLES